MGKEVALSMGKEVALSTGKEVATGSLFGKSRFELNYEIANQLAVLNFEAR